MTTTDTRATMTDEQIRELKDRADALTRAIEADFDLPHTAPSAHSLAYWLGASVRVSRLASQAATDAERLRAEVQRVESLHSPFKVYDDCCHEHKETDEGLINVSDIGLVCEAGFMYSICRHCCTNGYGDQTEKCVSEHDHGTGICETRNALAGAEVTV